MALKETLKQKIEEFRPRTTKLVKEFGKVVIDQVTIDQAIGGARDIRCLVTDISYLDPQEGIRFRGKTIPETFEALPKAPGSTYPTVESFWYFLLTGDVPTQAQVDEVVAEWKTRQVVPQYVFDALRALPARQPSDGDALGRPAGAAEGLQVRRLLQLRQVQQDDRLGIRLRRRQRHRRPHPDHRRLHLQPEVPGRQADRHRSDARHGRQLRPHDRPERGVQGRGPDVLHPALRPRVRQRLGPHHPPGALGPVRPVLRLLRRPQRPGRPAARPGQPGSARLDHEVPEEVLQGRGADQGTGHQGALGYAQCRPGHPGLRPRRSAQDRPALHVAARVLPRTPRA